MMESSDTLIQVKQAMLENRGYRARKIKDNLTRVGIVTGGIGVVFAVVLIFFYLVSVVLPIFEDAEIHPLTRTDSWQSKDSMVFFTTEEYGETVLSIDAEGNSVFRDSHDGSEQASFELPLEENETVVSADKVSGSYAWLAVKLSTGRILFLEEKYKLIYPEGTRKIIPSLIFPLGEEGINPTSENIKKISIYTNEEALWIATSANNNQVDITKYLLEENFMSGELAMEEESTYSISSQQPLAGLMLANDGRWLYTASKEGLVQLFTIDDDAVELIASEDLGNDAKITVVSPLLGDYSLLVGDSSGSISQWFGYREKESNQIKLTQVRNFQLKDTAITKIVAEKQRKGFIAVDSNNQLGVFYTTSKKTLLRTSLDENVVDVSLNAGSNVLVIAAKDHLETLELDNEHPEISWDSLWGKVWYESYSEPEYVWQSSASNNDFEPKFSLAPLTYGTLKAAFFAMMFAIPLALSGAIYTAYFMSPGLRSVVKPTVEIMEALPTVILGFLAGLWLAPFIEENLTGVMLFLVVMPVITLLSGLSFAALPKQYKAKIPDGWRPIILIPIISLMAMLSMYLNTPLENLLFDGNARVWLRDEAGITFDQRNALVVGLAMGFAVIPTIFSIAEDALFSVPKHLVAGSLALGANPWQTMVKVVLPTASPGIFSGVMIGMGRAVGETMIVLMATGNTPVMNMNIFEGMRTLAANIAVEMPEAEVASSHFRILFLAALVLFAFTFVANTLAEIIRHRLRQKYSSL